MISLTRAKKGTRVFTSETTSVLEAAAKICVAVAWRWIRRDSFVLVVLIILIMAGLMVDLLFFSTDRLLVECGEDTADSGLLGAIVRAEA